MKEIRLTEAERVALEAAWQKWDATGYHRDSPWGVVVADFVRIALAAVPRLALASPVVGEMVERAYAEGHLDSFFGRRGADRDAAIARDWAKSKAKAALTGEEGRDGEG